MTQRKTSTDESLSGSFPIQPARPCVERHIRLGFSPNGANLCVANQAGMDTTDIAMPHLNEAVTRAILINPLLLAAKWDVRDRTQVGTEIPVDGYDPEPWNGVTDYCLYAPSGEVLAIFEAKKPSRTRFEHHRTRLREAECQADHLFQRLLANAFAP